MYSSADDDKVEGDDRPLGSMDEIEVVATGEGSSVLVASVKAADGWSIYVTSDANGTNHPVFYFQYVSGRVVPVLTW